MDKPERDAGLAISLKWLVFHEVSNAQLATLSNVCSRWREIVHNALFEQAFMEFDNQAGSELLLLPSMLRYLVRQQKGCKEENGRASQQETFCASWFPPEKIREKVVLLLSIEDELQDIEQHMQHTIRGLSPPDRESVHINSSFGLSTCSPLRETSAQRLPLTADEDLSSIKNPLSGSFDGSYCSSLPQDDVKRVTTMDSWAGYSTPMEVLQPFGYSPGFVAGLIRAVLVEANAQATENHQEGEEAEVDICIDSSSSTTFAVRGATVARPDGYCLCIDAEEVNLLPPIGLITPAEFKRLSSHNRSDHGSDDDDDDDDYDQRDEDGAISQIRLEEFQGQLIRKEQRRRELQREVLPRVIYRDWLQQDGGNTSARCVQFLNATGDNAVCAVTPPFDCGPLSEPVTIFCVAIATEDGCFLSGLKHRFELGHLYPENEVLEVTERSSICITTESWVDTNGEGDSEQFNNAGCRHHHNSSFLSDDCTASRTTSGESRWSHDDKCCCAFANNGVKGSEDEDVTAPRRLQRGRFGPGSWHCYTAIFDGGRHSELRVDGMVEPVNRFDLKSGQQQDDLEILGRLDGLTLGSDHCFGVSLCCGQEQIPGGSGAIAEVVVFKGHLHAADLRCMEHYLMKKHGIPADPSSWQRNEMERIAEALLLLAQPASDPSGSPLSIPLSYLTQHRSVSWKQVHPVSGLPVSVSRIGARNRKDESSSEW